MTYNTKTMFRGHILAALIFAVLALISVAGNGQNPIQRNLNDLKASPTNIVWDSTSFSFSIPIIQDTSEVLILFCDTSSIQLFRYDGSGFAYWMKGYSVLNKGLLDSKKRPLRNGIIVWDIRYFNYSNKSFGYLNNF